jgi:hypothetical protein
VVWATDPTSWPNNEVMADTDVATDSAEVTTGAGTAAEDDEQVISSLDNVVRRPMGSKCTDLPRALPRPWPLPRVFGGMMRL